MWKDILSFELRYHLRQPWFAVSAFVFFCLAVALASSEAGTGIGGTPGTVLRNAPLVTVGLMPVLSLLSLFMITAFIANAALRDFEYRSDVLIFTKPLSKRDYLSGRFLGAMAVSLALLMIAVVGLMVAQVVPWQPATRLGPFSPAAHAFGLLVILIPNLLSMGSVFFALAIWSRRLSWTYLGVVFFIGLQDAIEILAQGLDHHTLGGLLEPSGIVALESMARHWTVAERSTRLPELSGVLLANRLLWLAFSLGLLGLSCWRFRLTHQPRGKGQTKPSLWRRLRRKTAVPVGPTAPRTAPRTTSQSPAARRALPAAIRRRFTTGSHLGQMLRQARIEISEVVPSTPFLTLLTFGLMITAAIAFVAGGHEGMAAYPRTEFMLRAIQLGARFTVLLILVFYAGEMIFNPRLKKISGLYDTLPVPSWVFLGGKLVALAMVTGLFLLFAVVTTVGVQLSKGYLHPDPLLYLRGLLVIALPLLLIIPLALFLQVLSNHKFLGLLSTTAVLIVRFALPRLGFEDNLYLFASAPAITYSGMNGYGHHLEPFLWFHLYWGFGSLLLLVATYLLWPRGIQVPWGQRLRVARRRLSKPVAITFAIGALGMASSGLWIFQRTHLGLGSFDKASMQRRSAAYERSYGAYRDVPLPRIESVYAEVDLYPEQRRVEIHGRYRLRNGTPRAIRVLPFTLTARWVEGVLPVFGGISLAGFDLPAHRVLVDDEELGFFVVELTEPLAPGASLEVAFQTQVDHRPFTNGQQNDLVVANGTFFTGREVLPTLGYAPGNQLQPPTERHELGLPPRRTAAARHDSKARRRNYLEADWIQLETLLSTSIDQQAVAPGDLLRSWTVGDRRHFHYKTSAPVTNLVPFLSGAYEVVRSRWKEVDIEIYFDPAHRVNIERFLEVTHASLDYMSSHFGPYPYPQLRIVEVPIYHGKTAFSLSQTIAFSEAWGFNANLHDAEIDWLTAVLAHEISHQWWNHQVVPADVQGATLIGESLAQYSAMMILRQLHGPEMLQAFSSFHRDRYLRGRGQAQRPELPLALVDNQDYLHYSKGSLAFSILEGKVGEATINRGLRAFLAETAFAGPPYATTEDLLRHLRQAVPTDEVQWIEALFETTALVDAGIEDGIEEGIGDTASTPSADGS